MKVGALIDEALHDGNLATLGGNVERGRARKVARVDRRTSLQKEIDHREMTGSRRTAERSRPQPVSGIYRGALIQQSGREIHAVAVGRCKQRRGNFDSGHLGLTGFVTAN